MLGIHQTEISFGILCNMNCRICDIELIVNINCTDKQIKSSDYICRTCNNKRHMGYRKLKSIIVGMWFWNYPYFMSKEERHNNKLKSQQKYRNSHSEEFSLKRKERYKLNKKRESKYAKEYRLKNPEKNKIQRKKSYEKCRGQRQKYRNEHKEETKKWKRDYYIKNSESIKLDVKIWRTTSSGIESKKKSDNRRRREFDFIPLNSSFPNSDGHHIDEKYVIYIPKKLHQSIYHDVRRKINMEQINAIAYFFLLMQNIMELGDF